MSDTNFRTSDLVVATALVGAASAFFPKALPPHSPAPWEVEDHDETTFRLIDAGKEPICYASSDPYLQPRLRGIEQDEANMERIAACVNACEGIDTHTLKSWGVGSYRELIQERNRIGGVLNFERDANRRTATLLLRLDAGGGVGIDFPANAPHPKVAELLRDPDVVKAATELLLLAAAQQKEHGGIDWQPLFQFGPERAAKLIDALADAAEAAVEYDNAIRRVANKGVTDVIRVEEGAAADGGPEFWADDRPDLNALYQDWMRKSRAALLLMGRTPEQVPLTYGQEPSERATEDRGGYQPPPLEGQP